jgi:hypothetical protein
VSADSQIVTRLLRLRSQVAAAAVVTRLRLLADALKFDPDQPRVPAGSPEGGQWTSEGGAGEAIADATVDTNRLGRELAQLGTQISIDASALTGISRIDETTKSLANTLAKVVDGIGIVAGANALEYGRVVHFAFANAVRFGNFEGIGIFDVETTHSLEPDAHYGARDSIRTDVVLRNEVGDIVAIYDVKTGRTGLSRSRVAELRAKTRVGPNIPIIEINLVRGVLMKHALARAIVWVRMFGW